MKTAVVMASLSRKAGGLLESVRGLQQATAALPQIDSEILALEDEFTAADLSCWQPLTVRTFPVVGPRQFGCSPTLKRALLESNQDLLHNHGLWMYPSIAVSAWHEKTRRPYVISPHGMLDPWALRNSGWKKRLATRLYEGEHLRRAACLRALCESEAQSIRAFGLRNPICVIPNGVDLPASDQSSTLEVQPSGFNAFAQGRKVLLYLGRIHPKKGLVNLIKAWEIAQRSEVGDQRSAEWVLAMAGWDQDAHEEELKNLTSELRLQTSVWFPGPRHGEAKSAAYYHCDAFILPSFSEGQPMTVLEAWAHGKPVLMTPECNLPAGFLGGAAIRIQTLVEEIARGLQDLFAMSQADRCAMGDRGKKLVAERFSWPKIAADMKAVYDWMLGGGAKPDCVFTP